jgi:hypothetical protein
MKHRLHRARFPGPCPSQRGEPPSRLWLTFKPQPESRKRHYGISEAKPRLCDCLNERPTFGSKRPRPTAASLSFLRKAFCAKLALEFQEARSPLSRELRIGRFSRFEVVSKTTRIVSKPAACWQPTPLDHYEAANGTHDPIMRKRSTNMSHFFQSNRETATFC